MLKRINKNFKDTYIFLKYLTIYKLINSVKLLLSFYYTRLSGNVTQWGQPMTLSIEPTTACNLKCPECPSGLRSFTRNTGNLKSDFFRKIIDEVHEKLIYLIFYFQGEPYINPQFLEMVSYASKKNIYTITSTNGHFLGDENCKKTISSGLSRLIISIDGTTQDVYESYRKEGQLSTVIKGARNIVKWKKEMKSQTPHVVFQFLVVRPNQHQINEVKDLAKEIGVDEVKFKTAQIYNYKNGHSLIPTIDKFSRYKKLKNGTYILKNKLKNECWKLWHSAVITWDGHVVPCCFDKDAKYKMGNLKENDLKTVWEDKSYEIFRNKIKSGRKEIDICTNCSEGCNVWK